MMSTTKELVEYGNCIKVEKKASEVPGEEIVKVANVLLFNLRASEGVIAKEQPGFRFENARFTYKEDTDSFCWYAEGAPRTPSS
jgi:hypothetical protein